MSLKGIPPVTNGTKSDKILRHRDLFLGRSINLNMDPSMEESRKKGVLKKFTCEDVDDEDVYELVY